jgi:hypothetical protein
VVPSPAWRQSSATVTENSQVPRRRGDVTHGADDVEPIRGRYGGDECELAAGDGAHPARERQRVEFALVLHEAQVARFVRQTVKRLRDLAAVFGAHRADRHAATIAQRDKTRPIRRRPSALGLISLLSGRLQPGPLQP